MKIIDNFEQISKLLRFERTGDCYYLEILLRAKDGNDVRKKHNNGDRTIREILLNHEGHLEELRDEIIKLCHEFNARAYIRLNRRNYARSFWCMLLLSLIIAIIMVILSMVFGLSLISAFG